MPRERRKRQRSFEGGDDRRSGGGHSHGGGSSNNMDVEVLIAHDPMLGMDSDDEIDLGGSVVSATSFAGSNMSGGGARRDSSQSSLLSGIGGGGSSSSNQKNKQRDRKKKEKEKKKAAEKNEDGVDNEEVFYVEKIKEKRWNTNFVRWEYLIKWQGFDNPADDTWEPVENMDCDDLLLEFETEWNKHPRFRFDRGENPREIVGLINCKGVPKFVVMYKGSDDAEIVTKDECYKKCPNLVIEFYESRQIAKPHEDLDFGNGNGTDSATTTAPETGSTTAAATTATTSTNETPSASAAPPPLEKQVENVSLNDAVSAAS